MEEYKLYRTPELKDPVMVAGLPPFLAATVISFISFVNRLPRLASVAAFLCLIVAHFE
jgi:hypothetical protein